MLEGQELQNKYIQAKYSRRKPKKAWRELTFKQKHWRNITSRLLNDYFGLLIIVVVILVLAGCYKYLIVPKYQSILGVIKTTYFEQEKLAPKYGELSSYRKILDTYNNLNPTDVDRIKNVIPEQYSKEDLFAELVFLISQRGYKIENIEIIKDTDLTTTETTGRRTPTTKVEKPAVFTTDLPSNIGQVSVKLEISKINYSGLKSLLWLFENSLRLIDIKTLSFDPVANKVSLEAVTYYFNK